MIWEHQEANLKSSLLSPLSVVVLTSYSFSSSLIALQMRSRLLHDGQYEQNGLPKISRYVRIDAIIEDFRAYEEDHIPNTDADEGRISSAVQRLVRVSVNLSSNQPCLPRNQLGVVYGLEGR